MHIDFTISISILFVVIVKSNVEICHLKCFKCFKFSLSKTNHRLDDNKSNLMRLINEIELNDNS